MTLGAQEKIPGYLYDYGAHVRNVKHLDYGAVGDGVNDDTAEIQGAIDLAYADGGGIVFIPEGIYMMTQMKMRTNVIVTGSGWGTVIKQIGSTTGNFVVDYDDTTERWILTKIQLDGNKGNQSDPNDGIHLSPAGPFTTNDNIITIKDVLITNFPGHGVYWDPEVRESLLERVKVDNCDLDGFRLISTDNEVLYCTAQSCGQSGFHLGDWGTRVVGCKAFGCVDGFKLVQSYQMLSCCMAEDNSNYGFYLDNVGLCQLIGCVANRNALRGFVIEKSSGFGGEYNHLVITATDNGGVPTQNYALQMSVGNPTNNIIWLSSHQQVTGDITATPPAGNEVWINGNNILGGNLVRKGLINSIFGTVAAGTTEHLQWGKEGSPAAGNPVWTIALDNSAVPDSQVISNDGTDQRSHVTFDHSAQELRLGTPGATASAGRIYVLIPSFSDAQRPAAAKPGRIIYNTTDGNLNIDTGAGWILPDGSAT